MERYGWEIRLSPESHPLELMIETTTRCNYDCIFCFRRFLKSYEYIDMNLDIFKRIIVQAKNVGVKKLSFSGWGESLVNKNISRFLKIAKEEGFYILLNSNGYFLKDFIEDILNVDELVISMDSIDEDLYRKIRIGGELPRVLNGIGELNKLREGASKPLIKFQFTITTLNKDNLPLLIKSAKKLKVKEVIVSNLIPITKEQEENLSCYMNKECMEFIEKLRFKLSILALEANVNIRLPEFYSKTERVCPFIREMAMYIRADGKTSPCIYYAHEWRPILYGIQRHIHPIIFGDILKEDILDIWRKRKYMEFRFNSTFFDMPSCYDCPLQKYCLLTMSNESDCWGGSPTCAHCPYSRDIVRCPL